jgi:hypothetical protein
VPKGNMVLAVLTITLYIPLVSRDKCSKRTDWP